MYLKWTTGTLRLSKQKKKTRDCILQNSKVVQTENQENILPKSKVVQKENQDGILQRPRRCTLTATEPDGFYRKMY